MKTSEIIKQDIEIIFKCNDLKSKSRERNLVMMRYLYFKLSKEFTQQTLYKIGAYVNRTHATVINGLIQFEILLNYFPEIKDVYVKLQKKYKAEKINDKYDKIKVTYVNLLKNKIITKSGVNLCK